MEMNSTNLFSIPLDNLEKIPQKIRIHTDLKDSETLLNITINLVPLGNQASILPSEIREVALWYDPAKSDSSVEKSPEKPPKLRVYSLQLGFD
jgi:hypothetical protein